MKLRKMISESIDFLNIPKGLNPQIGVTLGSGLSHFVNEVTIEQSWAYADIPHFFGPGVEGHPGKLILGRLNSIPLFVLQGRTHFYEGHSIQDCVFPTRVLSLLGIKCLILTNAAGGLEKSMTPGDFMIIDDHINLTGQNPLIGTNDASLGPRFPDMTEVYCRKYKDSLKKICTSSNTPHSVGVYCGLTGPTYETPAEVNYLKSIGVSAVGMSTVNEAITARHMGVNVLGLSCITNLAAGMSKELLDHSEVQSTAKKVEHQFCSILKEFIVTEFSS